MPTVTLRIEPELCGPFSIGTARIIKLIQAHFGFGLDAAAAYVNRCVFDGAIVEIPAPSALAAERFLAELAGIPRVPRVVATLNAEK